MHCLRRRREAYHEGMNNLLLRGPFVTLAQAVKLVGLAESGGQAKHLVRSGALRVNGQVVTQPGKKLVQGDQFTTADGQQWQISQ
jgi:ribosome-associated protein